ncbi:MAG: hypothetical protein ACFFAE_14650 [Candidatus Hodarchaeota archaeon]
MCYLNTSYIELQGVLYEKSRDDCHLVCFFTTFYFPLFFFSQNGRFSLGLTPGYWPKIELSRVVGQDFGPWAKVTVFDLFFSHFG